MLKMTEAPPQSNYRGRAPRPDESRDPYHDAYKQKLQEMWLQERAATEAERAQRLQRDYMEAPHHQLRAKPPVLSPVTSVPCAVIVLETFHARSHGLSCCVRRRLSPSLQR